MQRDIDKRFGYRHPTMSSAPLAYSLLAFPHRITSYSLCLLYMYHIPIFSIFSFRFCYFWRVVAIL